MDQLLYGLSDGTCAGDPRVLYLVAEERGVEFQPRVVTWFLNQVLNFRDGIQRGDTVVMPRKASGGHRVAQGIVAGGYEHWGEVDYRHRRRVRWSETDMPRKVWVSTGRLLTSAQCSYRRRLAAFGGAAEVDRPSDVLALGRCARVG